MLPQSASVPQSARRFGVGVDTSRYGHYAAFLRDDLQPAAEELQFAESAEGYGRLRQRLERIVQRHGCVEFVVRLDAAGQYADNLLHYLHSLAGASGSKQLGVRVHLVFAIWKSRRPFDPGHYAWDKQAHAGASDSGVSPDVRAAGPKPDEPARTEVTATRSVTLADDAGCGESAAVDFAHLKRQLPLARVLDQLGLSPRLRGSGPQRRGPCPIHRGDARGRTFSVHLDDGVFQCFDQSCGRKGDVIDLWAEVRGMPLRTAALDLVHTFGLEPTPRRGTEKRNG